MGLWHMDVDLKLRKVQLIYVDHPGASDALVQRCGACELVAERDLEAWIIDQAAPWDLINTDRGSFVR